MLDARIVYPLLILKKSLKYQRIETVTLRNVFEFFMLLNVWLIDKTNIHTY
jgi:hypothetical protein